MLRPNRILAVILIACLLSGSVLGGQAPTVEDQRKQRCIKLLESLDSRPQSSVSRVQSVPFIDLTRGTNQQAVAKIQSAQKGDILLLDDDVLRNSDLLKAIKASSAIFSIKSPSADSTQAKALLESPIGQAQTIIALPIDAHGVNKVFGTPEAIATGQAKYLANQATRFKMLHGSQLLAVPELGRTIAKKISEAAIASNTGMFILVAHNIGGSLVFPDGSRTSVSDIYRLLQSTGRPGLVLSCDTVHSDSVQSASVLTNAPLDIRSIADALLALQNGMGTIQHPVVADALTVVSNSLYSAPPDVGPRVKIIAFAAGGVLFLLAGIYFWECDRQQSCRG